MVSQRLSDRQVVVLESAPLSVTSAGNVVLLPAATVTAPVGFYLLSDGAATTITNAQSLYPQLWEKIPLAWKSGANAVVPQAVGNVSAGNLVAAIQLYNNVQNASVSVGTFAVRLVHAEAGNASAPAWSFSGDTNTGIYSGGTDILAFATAGVTNGQISAIGAWTIGPPNLGAGSAPYHIVNGPVLNRITSSSNFGIISGPTQLRLASNYYLDSTGTAKAVQAAGYAYFNIESRTAATDTVFSWVTNITAQVADAIVSGSPNIRMTMRANGAIAHTADAPSAYAFTIENTSGSSSTTSALKVTTNTASGARIISAQNVGVERFYVTGAGEIGFGAYGTMSAGGAFVFGASSGSLEHAFNTGNTNTSSYTVGQLRFGNSGSAVSPAITGTTNAEAASGLYLSAGTNNTNTQPDMAFNVRTSGNIDFNTLTSKAFAWTRFSTELGSVTRAGDWTFLGTAAAPIVSTPAVKFPSAQTASADPNTLDDYEEGTFSPEIKAQTPGTISVAYTTRTGQYTKIGNVVWMVIYIEIGAFTLGTASGYAYIDQLPAITSNASVTKRYVFPGRLMSGAYPASTTYFQGEMSSSGAIILTTGGSNAAADLQIGSIGAGDVISISGFYFV